MFKYGIELQKGNIYSRYKEDARSFYIRYKKDINIGMFGSIGISVKNSFNDRLNARLIINNSQTVMNTLIEDLLTNLSN